jgi:biotin carboxyl carrier protein
MRWNVLLAALVAIAAAAVLVTTEAPIEDPVWWYTNDTPPRLSLQGRSGPLRGQVDGTISLDPADRAHVAAVTLDGQPLAWSGSHLLIDSSHLPDGQHRVQVVARDTSRRQNEASASWTFVSDNTPPKLDLRLDPADGPVEGHTWVLYVKPDEPAAVQASIGDRPLRLQADGGGGFWALEGISPGVDAGSVTVLLTATDRLGNQGTQDKTWQIQRTTFPEDDLTLDPSQIQPQARAEENSRLGVLYQQEDGPKRWDGPFQVPVHGDITTQFGTHRSYEYHPGTDFAMPQGTPVKAPAPGTVVFEGMLPARGNVLVLDHGAGVYTTYAHLQRFEVSPGDDVSVGQTIARVGTTGFSTGPHLHWELWVDSANVDPMDWTKRAYP